MKKLKKKKSQYFFGHMLVGPLGPEPKVWWNLF
jgi:hypothetical protein